MASLQVVPSGITRAVVHIEANIMAKVVREKGGDGLVAVSYAFRASRESGSYVA